MTTEEEHSQIRDERDDARQDLRDTLAEVNAKVERARADLRPDHMIESHPVAACFVAGVLGYILGTKPANHGTGPLMLAGILGFALLKHSSLEGSGHNGGPSSTDD